MNDCRIELLSPQEAEDAARVAGVPAPLAQLNIFRVLLHRPATAKAVADLLLSLLFQGALDHTLRELVIMRIGWATGSDYEWTQHWALAQERFGVSREKLLAVRDWRAAACFDAAERAVLEATDETLQTGTLSSATWACCAEHLGRDAQVELVAAIGTWRLISQLTRSLEVPLELGVTSWPPDGRIPTGRQSA